MSTETKEMKGGERDELAERLASNGASEAQVQAFIKMGPLEAMFAAPILLALNRALVLMDSAKGEEAATEFLGVIAGVITACYNDAVRQLNEEKKSEDN